MEQQHWDWLLDPIRYFRAMDFCTGQGLSSEALAQRIVSDELERCREHSMTPFWSRPDQDPNAVVQDNSDTGDEELDAIILRSVRPRPDYKDLNLLSENTVRIWWEDGEGDIRPKDNRYVEVLKEWSRISRGAFLPGNIREVWDKPEQWPDCKVTVLFELSGQERVLEPWDGYGWID